MSDDRHSTEPDQHAAEMEERRYRWSTERVRNLISVLLVSGFLFTTILVIVLMALNKAPEDLLQTVASLYSGVTGAVLGYYFGKGRN